MRDKQEILNIKQLIFFEKYDKDNVFHITAEYVDPVDRKRYYVVFTKQNGWEHASISHQRFTPSWDIMCKLKDMFWRKDEACMQIHPREEDYVNMHEHCLHIWKPITEENGLEIPLPPSLMVGFKGVSQQELDLAVSLFLNSMSDEEKIKYGQKRGYHINRDMKRGNFKG